MKPQIGNRIFYFNSQKLIEIRKRYGLLARDVEQDAHFSCGHISRLENEKIKYPDIDVVMRLSAYFKVPMEYFILRHESAMFVFPELPPELTLLSVGEQELSESFNPLTHKRCRKNGCAQPIKPHSSFYKGKTKDGLQSWCMDCVRANANESNNKRRERLLELRSNTEQPEDNIIPSPKSMPSTTKRSDNKLSEQQRAYNVLYFLNIKK